MQTLRNESVFSTSIQIEVKIHSKLLFVS